MPETYPILSILIALPLLGSIVCLFLWKRENACRVAALSFSLVEMVLAWMVYFSPREGSTDLPGFFLHEEIPWIESFGISYSVGMDGISLLLVLLTSFMIFIAVLVSWRQIRYWCRGGRIVKRHPFPNLQP